MGASSLLLLLLPLLIGAASADVNVRFTADFTEPVNSTSWSPCGGAYRAEALAASPGLRIDGGGVAAACSTTLCAQVFAAMGYDAWALNAADIAMGPQVFVNAVMAAGGTKPVASNYDTTYTRQYANLGAAVLLAVSEGGTTTYSKAVALAIAAARDAGVDFDTTPVILSVNGIGTADITDLGASSAAAAVQKLAQENTEVDLVIATGISGLSDGTTNWAGDLVKIASLSASTSVQQVALGFANGVPTSATTTTTTCSSSSKSDFVDGVMADTVDYVPIVMLCDTGTAAREECDAGRAAVDAINNKFDGYFDDLLPLTKLEVEVKEFDGTQCKDDSPRTAWEEVSSGFRPVASIGPGGTTCTKSVASVSNRAYLENKGVYPEDDPVVMSESSTATSVSDRSLYPNLVRLSSSEDTVSQGVLAVANYYGWKRIAVVYDAADSWAADASRILSENLRDADGEPLGNKCVSSYCTRLPEAGTEAELTGIRFDEDGGLTADLADKILDELIAIDARIIYIGMHPDDQKILYERIKQTEKCYGAGYALLSGWLSEGIFFDSETGQVSTDAVDGARGLVLAKEAVDTSGSVGQDFIAHRTPGLDNSAGADGACQVAVEDQAPGKYCDQDLDGGTVGGYGPQVIDAVYTLAKALDSLSCISDTDCDRKDPDLIYEAIKSVGSGGGFESFSGNVALDSVAERQGSMEISNLQFVTSSNRRLAVPLSETSAEFVVVGRTVGNGFLLDGGRGEIVWPGGTTAVPLDHDPAAGDRGKGGNIPMGLVLGLIFGLFLPLLCVIGLVFARYRRKIQGKLKGARAELEAFRKTVVGMRVVTKAVAPAALPPPPGTARWYWQESAPRLHTHANLKPPHWVPYDASTSAAIEEAFQNGLYHILLGTAPRQYAVYPKRMKQVNEATAFERDLLREETAARPTADVERGARRPPDVDPAEPCMVLQVGSIVQIARQGDDGWAFGSLTLEAPVARPGLARNFRDDGLPAGWSRHQGWFELDKTDVPTADQLAELQKRTGGADALATPSYWDDVKDKTVAQTFALNSSSGEYKRVEDCFMLTLWDKNWRIRIQSIERVQNVSLWQSYRVKRSTICSREHDEKAALHKYVRCWVFHGCPSDVASKVIQQGFNRSYTSNGKVYGKGVYFARDASYSTYPKYSAPDKHGVQYMFAARAAVGEYCRGKMDQLAPDVRDARTHLLYDSTVDNPRDPSIFVTYHDAQAYPEYLIKFTQGNPPRAHPAANLPAPVSGRYGRYRPNILADEGLM